MDDIRFEPESFLGTGEIVLVPRMPGLRGDVRMSCKKSAEAELLFSGKVELGYLVKKIVCIEIASSWTRRSGQWRLVEAKIGEKILGKERFWEHRAENDVEAVHDPVSALFALQAGGAADEKKLKVFYGPKVAELVLLESAGDADGRRISVLVAGKSKALGELQMDAGGIRSLTCQIGYVGKIRFDREG